MATIERICVYCGSSPGAQPAYIEMAATLGAVLGERRIDVVYGGANVGLMGAVADAALLHGGKVIGVIPKSFADKVAHTDITELHIVETMHERKTRMFELADAFIALPGGMGTIEELFEALTWAQLGFHGKPCGLLNICGYFDKLLGFLDDAVMQLFIKPVHREMLLMADTPDALLAMFEHYRAPHVEKWIEQ